MSIYEKLYKSTVAKACLQEHVEAPLLNVSVTGIDDFTNNIGHVSITESGNLNSWLEAHSENKKRLAEKLLHFVENVLQGE